MNFVIDANISQEIAEHLSTSFTHTFISIQKTNPCLNDEDILMLAVEENAIVITADKDFGEMVFRQKLLHKGILLIRIGDGNYEELKLILENIIRDFGESLTEKFVVYQKNKIRIR